MAGELTGEEVQDVVDILNRHVERADLEQLLYTSLDKQLDDYVGADTGWGVQVFQLVRKANSQGFIADLLKALADFDKLPADKRARFAALAAAVAARSGDGGQPTEREPEADPVPGFLARLTRWLSVRSNRILVAALLAYAVVLTMVASIPVSASLMVKSSAEQRQQDVANGRVSADDKRPQYRPPRPGFSIHYRDYYYAVNGSGDARLTMTPFQYLGAILAGHVQVEVQYPSSGGSTPADQPFGGFTVAQIQLEKSNDDPGASDTMGSLWDEGGHGLAAASGAWSLVGPAQAAPATGGRLYVQSVAVDKSAAATQVDATLDAGGNQIALAVLGIDLSTAAQAQLAIVPGAIAVQNFQSFFPLPQPSLTGGATITLKASGSLFSAGYVETFKLPDAVPLGKPVDLAGSAGGKLVVQLAYPIDVVFFERQNTPALTDKLTPLVAAAGFATRLNTKSVTLPGSYNVVYAGADVPVPALQKVLQVFLDNGVDIRSIQPRLQLRNGIQNQIQVGSSSQVACLPPLTAEQRARLLRSEADFDSVAARPGNAC